MLKELHTDGQIKTDQIPPDMRSMLATQVTLKAEKLPDDHLVSIATQPKATISPLGKVTSGKQLTLHDFISK